MSTNRPSSQNEGSDPRARGDHPRDSARQRLAVRAASPHLLDADRIASRAKPLVTAILRSPLHPLLSFGLMLISFEGRKTGRRYTFPVGYQQSGRAITVLASRARRKGWWRNFREPHPVELLVRGRRLAGEGRVLAGDSAEFREAVEATFRRLPRLAGQFGIAYRRGQAIDAAQWRTIASDGAVVKVELRP